MTDAISVYKILSLRRRAGCQELMCEHNEGVSRSLQPDFVHHIDLCVCVCTVYMFVCLRRLRSYQLPYKFKKIINYYFHCKIIFCEKVQPYFFS